MKQVGTWGFSPLRLHPSSLLLPPALGRTYNDPVMAIIEIQGLEKSYRVYQKREGLAAAVAGLFHRQHRLVEAVRGIDLQVEQGEFVAFLGPNGAGKTTTLKLLSGVISPSGGAPASWASRRGNAKMPIGAVSRW